MAKSLQCFILTFYSLVLLCLGSFLPVESKVQVYSVEPNREDLIFIEKKYIDQKSYGKALHLLNQKISKNPEDSYAYFLKGLVFHRLAYRDLAKYKTLPKSSNHFKLALDCYNLAWERGFRTAQLYFHRGECYLNLGKNEKAMQDLDQSLKINSQRDWVWATRAIAYQHQGKLDLALADMKKAIKLNTKRTTNYAKLAAIYEDRGQLDKAIQSCGQAITMSPKWSAAYMKRANLFIKKKEFAKAQADLNRILELDPNNASALKIRGELNAKQGQLEQATIDLSEAREIDRDLSTKQNANALLKPEEAKKMFLGLEKKSTKLSRFNPSNTVLFDLGIAQFALGKWTESRKTFGKIIASQKDEHQSGQTRLYSAAYSNLAARSMGEERAANIVLRKAIQQQKEKCLPHTIARYLSGGCSTQSLIKEASSKEEISRVRFFIGAHLRRTGQLASARKNLEYGLNHGSPKVDESMLSVIELERIRKQN